MLKLGDWKLNVLFQSPILLWLRLWRIRNSFSFKARMSSWKKTPLLLSNSSADVSLYFKKSRSCCLVWRWGAILHSVHLNIIYSSYWLSYWSLTDLCNGRNLFCSLVVQSGIYWSGQWNCTFLRLGWVWSWGEQQISKDIYGLL